MHKFTYPNEGQGREGWTSTNFFAPASKQEIEEELEISSARHAGYHDRDEITVSKIILTWTSSSGKGCSLEEVPEEIRAKKRSVILILNYDNILAIT